MLKTKLCKYCKTRQPLDEGIQTPAGWFCKYDHAIKYANDKSEQARLKAKAKQVKQIKKENSKALRDLNRSTLSWQHKHTQRVFNRMRVLQELKWFKDRGLEPTCISCNKTDMDWCCGHLKTVGAQGVLRYSKFNTFLQCNRYCNKGLSGNINGNKTTRGYLQGLLDRFGEKAGESIINRCESYSESSKWTCEELEEMRKCFSEEVRKLESEME